jgi:hypothetical protein
MEKDISVMQKSTTSQIAILLPDKQYFKQKSVRRDKEDHYIQRKGTIQQEDITVPNMHATNIGASKFIKSALLSINE